MYASLRISHGAFSSGSVASESLHPRTASATRAAEALLDLGEDWLSTAVLCGIVEQAGNGLVFVPSGLDDQRRDAEQVRDVGDIAPLPGLLRMQGCREGNGIRVPVGEDQAGIALDGRGLAIGRGWNPCGGGTVWGSGLAWVMRDR
jgi:hypothetical protein